MKLKIECAHDKLVDPKQLKPHPRNPNKHPKRQIELLCKIIKEQGFRNPIVVSESSGFITKGHARLAAALKIGAKIVPVDFQQYQSEKHELADMVADNKIAELAETDDDVLDSIVTDFKVADFDLEMLGIAGEFFDEPKDGLTDPDVIPAMPDKAKARRGDVYQLGGHRLMCGDCSSLSDVTTLMDGEKARLIATDPPYGVDYSKTKDGIPRSGFKNHQDQWGDIKNDDLEGSKLQKFLESVFKAALPHLDKAAWYLWHAHLTQGFFSAAAAAAAADVLLHRQIIWKKPGFVLTRSGMYHWAHEPCFYGWVRGQKPQWLGDKSQTSVWEIGRDEDRGLHPTQKPVALFEIPILNHLKNGEIAYEPFGGSGSQFIAAERTGRRCFGLEIEPRYVDVIINRWEQFTGSKAKKIC